MGTRQQTQIRLPRSLHARLRRQAAADGVSLNGHMLALLAAGAERWEDTDMQHIVYQDGTLAIFGIGATEQGARDDAARTLSEDGQDSGELPDDFVHAPASSGLVSAWRECGGAHWGICDDGVARLHSEDDTADRSLGVAPGAAR